MMNELNKRANLLIEQLEVIAFFFVPSYRLASFESTRKESVTAAM